MKKNKGFIGITAIVGIVIFLVLGGGAVYYISKTTAPETTNNSGFWQPPKVIDGQKAPQEVNESSFGNTTQSASQTTTPSPSNQNLIDSNKSTIVIENRTLESDVPQDLTFEIRGVSGEPGVSNFSSHFQFLKNGSKTLYVIPGTYGVSISYSDVATDMYEVNASCKPDPAGTLSNITDTNHAIDIGAQKSITCTYSKVSLNGSSQPELSQATAEQLVYNAWGDCGSGDCGGVSVEVSQNEENQYVVSAIYVNYDDSTSHSKKEAVATYSNGYWSLGIATNTWKCHPGRGHQDFSTELCI